MVADRRRVTFRALDSLAPMSDDESEDATDATSTPERTGILSRLAPKPSAPLSDRELGGRMRSLDVTERKWGFAVAVIPILSALISQYVPDRQNELVKLVHGHCLAPAHIVDKSCVALMRLAPSVPLDATRAILGVIIVVVVWQSLRSLVIVATILAGLASGLLGILAVGYGAWLMVRSWRLQRYGVTDAASARKLSIERSKERRETKKVTKENRGATTTSSGPRPVEASKRYTSPKAKPKKR
jgi:hypothetical protein